MKYCEIVRVEMISIDFGQPDFGCVKRSAEANYPYVFFA